MPVTAAKVEDFHSLRFSGQTLATHGPEMVRKRSGFRPDARLLVTYIPGRTGEIPCGDHPSQRSLVPQTEGKENTMPAPATLAAFQAGLRGELLQRSDTGYEAARQVYNGMINRHPRLIARCANVADVIAAVHFARDH